MILVTGPTGTIGSALVPQLVQDGATVRALAHSAAGRARIQDDGAEAVDGDYDDPATLEQAMDGCDRVFVLSPPGPRQVERETRLVDIAGRVGVRRLVVLSAMGASATSPVEFLRRHAEIDDHVAASGLDYTILRPAGFMQAHLLPVATVMREGAWYGMCGDGPTNFVDARDVAAVAAHVLTTPGHVDATYEVTGPAPISLPEAAGVLSQVLGRPVRYVDVPADDFRASLVQAGLPEGLADALVKLYEAVRAGHMATVTNEVEKATGRPARTYRQFAEDHAEAFSEA